MLIQIFNRVHPMDKNSAARLCASLGAQLNLHVAPAWGLPANTRVEIAVPNRKGDAGLYIVDEATVEGALGYHEQSHGHRPAAFVFFEVAKEAGVPLTSVMSHELVELFLNPHADKWIPTPLPTPLPSVNVTDVADNAVDSTSTNGSTSAKRFYPREGCDPVQERLYPLGIDIHLSDFVLPAWFDPKLPGPRSYLASVGSASDVDALGLAPGGYATHVDSTDWQVRQVFADTRGQDRHAIRVKRHGRHKGLAAMWAP